MEGIKRAVGIWTGTYLVATVLVVYLLKLPLLISGEGKLVQEYYYTNMWGSLAFDYFLVAFYLACAWFVWSRLNIGSYLGRNAVVALTTVAISGSFMIYFLNKKPDTSFFYRWFQAAGIKAVAYDIVLLLITYNIYRLIDNRV